MNSHQAGEEVVLRTLAREGGWLQFSRLTYDGILAAGRLARARPRLDRQAGRRLGPRPGTAEAAIMTRAGPDPATEVWTYGGVRVGNDGKRVHAWVDASGEELLFSRAGARMAVGSQYTVSVSRHDETITLHGTPAYAGSPLTRPPAAPSGPSTPSRRPAWR